MSTPPLDNLETLRNRLLQGDPRHREKLASQGKMMVRERLHKLLDAQSFVEDGLFANCRADGLPADGVVTGFGSVGGRKVGIVANDSSVKAGSWGARTVEKMIRLQEMAASLQVPVFYLVDSAGARITDQVEMFPGRRGAGRIFYLQSRLSGKIPQICILFGPSAAGGAYIPAFCDLVIMVEKNASMYLGSPRMAEVVIGEKVSLEEMGGARMHCSVSGCGDLLAPNEEKALELARQFFDYLPNETGGVGSRPSVQGPSSYENLSPHEPLESIIPTQPTRAYDMHRVLNALVDKKSFFELKPLYAKEIITGFARMQGHPIGVVANQPSVKGGVLFAESANKAARFIQLCSSYGMPLLFLADVPGFMVGSQVEKQGIIRAGAKMIHAVSNAAVPKITLIVRKAFGAGLYAMAGPAFGSEAVLALPTAQIAVMGAQPALYAVHYHRLSEMSDAERRDFLEEQTRLYEKDVELERLAAELVIDHIVAFEKAREELCRRFDLAIAKDRPPREHLTIMPM